MTEVTATPTKVTMYRLVLVNGEARDGSVMYEGEIPMADQPANMKALIGDGQAKVTASRELSEKNYGAGGSVYVSVTLTCDQSEHMVETAAAWTRHLAERYANEEFPKLKQTLQSLGIIT